MPNLSFNYVLLPHLSRLRLSGPTHQSDGTLQSKLHMHLYDALYTHVVLILKNRWILVEFLPIPSSDVTADVCTNTTEVTGKHIWSALRQSVITHFGHVGWGAVGASLNGAFYANAVPASR